MGQGCSYGRPARQGDSAQQTEQPEAAVTVGWTAAHGCSQAEMSGDEHRCLYWVGLAAQQSDAVFWHS